jgi:hypothetical protein
VTRRPVHVPPPRVIAYPVEQLFEDQDRDWVVDTIPALLAWIPGRSDKKRKQPYRFDVEHSQDAAISTIPIDLTWDTAKLERLVPGVTEHARRLREGRSAQREHVTELAAYGLTFVAISALMPGRRVKTMRMGYAPDIVLDDTPGALRGVETAGRSTGGRRALLVVRDGNPAKGGKSGAIGKATQLLARTDLAEIHLSLWCASPRIGIMERLRP